MESNWRRHRGGTEDDDGWRKWGKHLCTLIPIDKYSVMREIRHTVDLHFR